MKRVMHAATRAGKNDFMLRDCVDLDALEQNAQRVMRPESWVFCDTGADDEITRRRMLRPGGS